MAVAVSLTRSTEADVRRYLQGNQAIGRLVVAVPSGGPSQRSVLCGAHADVLAEALAARLKEDRTRDEATNPARAHLFMAVPNAFPFYLGRHIHTLKPVTLYEFDFHAERDGSYQPSVSLPEAAQVAPTADQS
ncbi:SMODS-associated and fused to various effectors sensor domain protein [compost metagenome]